MADYPTTATHALSQVFQSRATSTFSVSLGLGLAGSSWFFFQNLDTNLWSPLAMIGSEESRKKTGVEGRAGQGVDVWAWYMKRAVPTTIASLALGITGLTVAGFSIPVSSFSTYPRDLRRILFGSVIAMASTLPYTWLFISSSNKSLLRFFQDSEARRAMPNPSGSTIYADKTQSNTLLPEEESESIRLLESLKTWHVGRTVLAATGWVLAVGGVMLAY